MPVPRAQSKLITDEGTREHRLAVTALVVVTWGALITIYCSSRNSSDAHRSRSNSSTSGSGTSVISNCSRSVSCRSRGSCGITIAEMKAGIK